MKRNRDHRFMARGVLLGLLAVVAGLLLRAPIEAAPSDMPFQYYFPVIGRQHVLCHPSATEQALAHLLITDPEQRRPLLRCNPWLEQVAQAHAADMATRRYVGYITAEGLGMNDLVRETGYRLPDTYSTAPGANQVAAIAVGHETAPGAWAGLVDPSLGSQLRTHLLGLDPFFARQIDYGIGHVYDPASVHGHYWVIVTAEPLYWPADVLKPASAPGQGGIPSIQLYVIHVP